MGGGNHVCFKEWYYGKDSSGEMSGRWKMLMWHSMRHVIYENSHIFVIDYHTLLAIQVTTPQSA